MSSFSSVALSIDDTSVAPPLARAAASCVAASGVVAAGAAASGVAASGAAASGAAAASGVATSGSAAALSGGSAAAPPKPAPAPPLDAGGRSLRRPISAYHLATAPFSAPWETRLRMVPRLRAARWSLGDDSLGALWVGAARSQALRRWAHAYPAVLPATLYFSTAALLCALFLDDEAVAGTLAIASLVVALPGRLYFLSVCSRVVLWMLARSFDFWLPHIAVLGSCVALADLLQWKTRALAVVSLYMGVFSALAVDSSPGGSSALSLLSQVVGLATGAAVVVGVSTDHVRGMVYRDIFRVELSIQNISNIEIFRATQTLLLALLFKTVFASVIRPRNCKLLRAQCAVEEDVAADDDLAGVAGEATAVADARGDGGGGGAALRSGGRGDGRAATAAAAAPSPPHLRPATAADAPAIAAIYGHYVRTSAITWAYAEEAPSPDVYAAKASEGLPFFVAVDDAPPAAPPAGAADAAAAPAVEAVIGYAYLSPFRARAGWRRTLEVSVYVAPGFERRGVGRALLRALVAAAAAGGAHALVSFISLDADDAAEGGAGAGAGAPSVALHASEGFVAAGRLREAGWKGGAWRDCVIMQRALRPAGDEEAAAEAAEAAGTAGGRGAGDGGDGGDGVGDGRGAPSGRAAGAGAGADAATPSAVAAWRLPPPTAEEGALQPAW